MTKRFWCIVILRWYFLYVCAWIFGSACLRPPRRYHRHSRTLYQAPALIQGYILFPPSPSPSKINFAPTRKERRVTSPFCLNFFLPTLFLIFFPRPVFFPCWPFPHPSTIVLWNGSGPTNRYNLKLVYICKLAIYPVKKDNFSVLFSYKQLKLFST